MPSQEEFDELKGRIVELENKLSQATTPAAKASVTAEEMQAYAKVRDLLAADYGDFCGINDCYRPVLRCYSNCMTRCISRCIYECTCGPCNLDPGTMVPGGLQRFGGLGG